MRSSTQRPSAALNSSNVIALQQQKQKQQGFTNGQLQFTNAAPSPAKCKTRVAVAAPPLRGFPYLSAFTSNSLNQYSIVSLSTMAAPSPANCRPMSKPCTSVESMAPAFAHTPDNATAFWSYCGSCSTIAAPSPAKCRPINKIRTSVESIAPAHTGHTGQLDGSRGSTAAP